MPISRTMLAAVTAALVFPLVATTSTQASGVSTPDTIGVADRLSEDVQLQRVRQAARLLMHPQLADAGARARAASKAHSAMTAQFRPAKRGRVVHLQKKAGSRWVKVKTAKQNGKGRAEFTAPFKVRRRIQVYRVYAPRSAGLAAVTSRAVSTNKWGAPALDDAFSGTQLPSGWAHRQTEYDGLRKCAKSSTLGFQVVDGNALRLSVIDDPFRPTDVLDPNPKCSTSEGNFHWRLTGQVSTEDQRSFRYGYAAARIKFQPRAGQHGAFWLQPASQTAKVGSPKETGAEIDVIEWFGNRANDNTELTSFAHYYPESVQDPRTEGVESKKVCGLINSPHRYGNDWAGKYHVFSLEWTPRQYVFRIDGKETCRSRKGVSGQRQFLILSLQSNIYEIPLLDGDPAAPHTIEHLPQHMYVDWVRFWKR